MSLAILCGQPHRAEVFFADNAYWKGQYPGDGLLAQEAQSQCNNEYFTYVGIAQPQSIYNWDDIFPSATDWNSGMRELVCVAYYPTANTPGGALISGSIKGSAR